jgi:hypothetical protein
MKPELALPRCGPLDTISTETVHTISIKPDTIYFVQIATHPNRTTPERV